jgi:hypothetical protein
MTPLIYELKGEVALKKVELVLQNQPPSVSIAMDPKRLSRFFIISFTTRLKRCRTVERFSSIFLWKRISCYRNTGYMDAGYKPEAMAHLFEPFFSYGKSHGTGLVSLSVKK